MSCTLKVRENIPVTISSVGGGEDDDSRSPSGSCHSFGAVRAVLIAVPVVLGVSGYAGRSASIRALVIMLRSPTMASASYNL
jgi:hypothetical protein